MMGRQPSSSAFHAGLFSISIVTNSVCISHVLSARSLRKPLVHCADRSFASIAHAPLTRWSASPRDSSPKTEKLASALQLEDVGAPSSDDNLSTLYRSRFRRCGARAERRGERLVFVVAHERIETHIEGSWAMRAALPRSELRRPLILLTVWRATPIFCASYSWVIPSRVLSESMF